MRPNSGFLPFRPVAVLLAALFSVAFAVEPRPLGEPDKTEGNQYEGALRLGQSRWQEGDFEEAFEWLIQARELAQKNGDIEKEVKCLLLLGKLCWSLGRPEESPGYYSDALAAAERISSPKDIEEAQAYLRIWALYSQGKTDRLAGEQERSILNLNAAVAGTQKLASPEHEVKCLRQLSLAYWAKQDFEIFLALNTRSLGIARELHDQREQVKCMLNLGLYYFHANDFTEALNYYSEAKDMARNIGKQDDESFCLRNIGIILMSLGFYERSLDFLLEAYDLDHRSGNIHFLPESLINLGEAFQSKGLIFRNRADFYRALDFYHEALDSAEKSPAEKIKYAALYNMGSINLDLANHYTAQHYLLSALRLAEKVHDQDAATSILNDLGTCCLRMGEHEKAFGYFQRALELGDHSRSNKRLWEPLYHLGECYERQGAYEQALTCYRNSIDAIDFVRSQIHVEEYKVGFARGKIKVYEALASLLFRANRNVSSPDRTAEIFQIVERAKARAFLETLGQVENDIHGGLDLSLTTQEGKLSNHIAAIIREMSQREISRDRRLELKRKLEQTEEEYLRLLSRISGETSEREGFISPLPVKLEQIQENLLDEKTAVLEYFLGESQSFLLSITRKDVRLTLLPPKREIEKSISAYLRLLSDPPKGKWKGFPAGKRLSQDLLYPGLKNLPTSIDQLIVIPDGGLNSLPFETLSLPSNQNSREGDFLISQYAVSYAASCSSLFCLKEKQRRVRPAKSLLALGDPLYPELSSPERNHKVSAASVIKDIYTSQGFHLDRLGESEKEIKNISRFFPKERTDLYVRRQASEEKVKGTALENYEIIHFACHGFQDEEVPFRSGLFLSLHKDQREDGFLQAREITGLRFRVGLIVLSACQTSRGYMEKAEGIMGLTRAFFYAGAMSVVSSLWEVSDKAAAEFMGYFYDYLARENSKAQALRLAKVRMLKSKYAHPFYWAAFVLHGEPFSGVDFL